MKLTSGVVRKIAPTLGIPEDDAINMDFMLVSENGKRTISPLVETIFYNNSLESTYEDKVTQLGFMLLTKYKARWLRLKEVSLVDYDPLSNFHDTKSSTTYNYRTSGGSSRNKGGNTDSTTYGGKTETTYGGKVDDTRTDQLTNTKTFNDTTTETPAVQQNTFGFNSSTAVPSSSTSGTDTSSHTGTITDLDTGTQTNSRVNSGSDATQKSGTDSRSNQSSYEDVKADFGIDSTSQMYKRKGNIGNHTNQQLLEEEISLWKWSWYNSILEDIIFTCTIPIYSY